MSSDCKQIGRTQLLRTACAISRTKLRNTQWWLQSVSKMCVGCI